MTRATLRNLAAWLGLGLIAAVLVGYGYASSVYRRDHALRADGCLAHVPAPATVVIATDLTDRLAPDQPRRWRASVEAELARMPPSSKVYLTEIGETTPAEVKFIATPCTPPSGDGPVARNIREALRRALAGEEAKLQAAEPREHSAIRGTVNAIANDPVFAGPHRLLVLESDMLENENRSMSAYRHPRSFLLPPSGKPLAGVTVDVCVLRNMRDARFQTPRLIETWKAWVLVAGGRIAIDAPWLGYVPPGTGT